MAGAQSTINNQLKAATATVTETATMTVTTMTIKTKVTAAAAAARHEAWWQRGSGCSDSGSGSVAAAWRFGDDKGLTGGGKADSTDDACHGQKELFS